MIPVNLDALDTKIATIRGRSEIQTKMKDPITRLACVPPK